MNDRFDGIKAIVDKWKPTNGKDRDIVNSFLALYKEFKEFHDKR